MPADRPVVWLKDLPSAAVNIAGGKGASLASMIRAGLSVPPAFVVCAEAFDIFLEAHGAKGIIRRAISNLDVSHEADLNDAATTIGDFIVSKPLPDVLARKIADSYGEFGPMMPVAVRSSAISEDSEAASFAGQQGSFLNVRGAESVLHHVRACWTSFFTARALFYRAQKGSLDDLSMAVVVQKMAMPDKSGVMFTADPVRNRRDQMVVEAVYGLGEAIVSGLVTPDNYILDHDSGDLIQETVAVQPIAVMCDTVHGGTLQVNLPPEKGRSRTLTDAELRDLHAMGLAVERYFGKPQDVEWCIEVDQLQLLQSRPITTL